MQDLISCKSNPVVVPEGDHYTVDEWRTVTEGAGWAQVDHEQITRLHRHWIWTNYAKHEFENALAAGGWDDYDDWTARLPWALFVWYGLLYVVVEGFTAREILSASPLVVDLDQIRNPLRDARHAMFHVDRDHHYYDERLIAIVRESAAQVRRVHDGLGQLALDEMRRRRATREPLGDGSA